MTVQALFFLPPFSFLFLFSVFTRRHYLTRPFLFSSFPAMWFNHFITSAMGFYFCFAVLFCLYFCFFLIGCSFRSAPLFWEQVSHVHFFTSSAKDFVHRRAYFWWSGVQHINYNSHSNYISKDQRGNCPAVRRTAHTNYFGLEIWPVV